MFGYEPFLSFHHEAMALIPNSPSLSLIWWYSILSSKEVKRTLVCHGENDIIALGL